MRLSGTRNQEINCSTHREQSEPGPRAPARRVGRRQPAQWRLKKQAPWAGAGSGAPAWCGRSGRAPQAAAQVLRPLQRAGERAGEWARRQCDAATQGEFCCRNQSSLLERKVWHECGLIVRAVAAALGPGVCWVGAGAEPGSRHPLSEKGSRCPPMRGGRKKASELAMSPVQGGLPGCLRKSSWTTGQGAARWAGASRLAAAGSAGTVRCVLPHRPASTRQSLAGGRRHAMQPRGGQRAISSAPPPKDVMMPSSAWRPHRAAGRRCGAAVRLPARPHVLQRNGVQCGSRSRSSHFPRPQQPPHQTLQTPHTQNGSCRRLPVSVGCAATSALPGRACPLLEHDESSLPDARTGAVLLRCGVGWGCGPWPCAVAPSS